MFLQTDMDFMNSILGDPANWAIFVALIIWSLIWKGFALWKSARNNQKNWFVIFMVVNTIGILEIIYLFYFSSPKLKKNDK